MHKEILKDLKAKKYAPIYLLQGSEPYFVDQVAKYLEQNVLTETEKAFNLTVFYGKDTNYQNVLIDLRRPPMMAERQLVFIKEAQSMKDLKNLASYCENPVKSSILVIVFKNKKLDGKLKIAKAIKKNGVTLTSAKLYDNQVGPWILAFLKEKGFPISPGAIELLCESLGTRLSKIANELDKMLINLKAGTKITPELIQKHIGISKDYNVFEFQKSLGIRDELKSFRIADYFAQNPKSAPLVLIISSLFSYFTKLYVLHHNVHARDEELKGLLGINNTYFIRDYKSAARKYSLVQTIAVLRILYQFDLRSKGIDTGPGTSEAELVKELTLKILAA